MDLITLSRRLAPPAVALLLAACGGGGRADGPTPPTIGALSDQTIDQDAALSVPLPVNADATTPGPLNVTAAVADGSLVPASNVAVSGDGTARTLNLRPAEDRTGTTLVVVTVTDALGRQASRGFRLVVNPVYAPFVSYADSAFAQADSDAPKPVSGLTFQQDGDGDPAAFDAQLAQ